MRKAKVTPVILCDIVPCSTPTVLYSTQLASSLLYQQIIIPNSLCVSCRRRLSLIIPINSINYVIYTPSPRVRAPPRLSSSIPIHSA